MIKLRKVSKEKVFDNKKKYFIWLIKYWNFNEKERFILKINFKKYNHKKCLNITENFKKKSSFHFQKNWKKSIVPFKIKY
jgi:hypothetical protein